MLPKIYANVLAFVGHVAASDAMLEAIVVELEARPSPRPGSACRALVRVTE